MPKGFELTAEERKLLRQTYVRNNCIFFAPNNIVMCGRGFALSMIPALKKFYANDQEGFNEAFSRHFEFFNTHACMAGLLAGLVVALEKEKAEKGTVEGGTISNIKASLMGPLAGIGDSFFFNCIRIIAAGIGIGFAQQGNILGAFIFILIYGGSYLVLKYYLLVAGYKVGTGLIDKAFSSGIIPLLTKLAGIMGMIMVGATIATNVNVVIAAKPVIGGASLDIQGILDGIAPGILSLIAWFITFKAVKKGLSPMKLVLIILGLCIVLSFIGVF